MPGDTARQDALARLINATDALVATSSQDEDGRFIVGEDEIWELADALAAARAGGGGGEGWLGS